MRLRFAALAGAVGLALALAGPAVTASAAQLAPAAPLFNPGNGFYIDLLTGGNAITSEGVGSQVDITSSGSKWNTVAATHGYKVENQNGNCLEAEGSPYHVNIETCAAGDGAQWFIFNGAQLNASIQNYATGLYLGVFSPAGPKPVYDEAPHSGFYDGWGLAS